MIDLLTDMFSYTFMIRALVVGVLIALSSSLVGVVLVLKRFSMIGDGLSHIGFGALAIAALLNISTPLYLSIPLVMAAAFFILRLNEKGIIKGDSAIAMVSSASLALGVIIMSLSNRTNTDLMNYMFGSIFALNDNDVFLSISVTILVVILFILFYNKIFIITFDEQFARASGVNVGLYNIFIALFTALTIVMGMNLMGAMLVSGLIVFPPLTAMRLCKKFKSVIICSGLVSVLNLMIGLVTAYALATPPGASIIAVNVLVFIIFSIINAVKKAVYKRNMADF